MKITAAQLAQLIGATVDGNPDVLITGPAKIEEASPGTITFFGNPAYEKYVYTTAASAVLVQTEFVPKRPVSATLLRVEDVYLTVSKLLEQFQGASQTAAAGRVSEHAIVDESAQLGQGVSVGRLSIISAGAVIGDGAVIHDQVYIGEDVKIGAGTLIYPGVRVLKSCVVGADCTLHPNAVIGADGFGYAPDPKTGVFSKIPHVGNVILEDRVDIGANTCVDRASMGSTILRAGVKLDNLIQIAHNVEIDTNTVMAAQVGVAGSAKVGKNCMIGGQVGISGHKSIADGTRAQAQTGITNNIKKPGTEVAGTPFMDWKGFTRSAALFKMMPGIVQDFRDRLRRLENRDA